MSAPLLDPGLLTRALRGRVPQSIRIAIDGIRDDDERSLWQVEVDQCRHAVASVRRARGAARRLARLVAAELDVEAMPVLRGAAGEPLWPEGIVGSMAHDESFAAAALAPASAFAGVGIDIEPPVGIGRDLVRLIAFDGEDEEFCGTPVGEKALFAVKEAVFKAVYPSTRYFLDFSDVRVHETGVATVTSGHTVQWTAITDPWVVAVAWWR